ncbi:MAG TPA: toll/interleukin-1 receptor domain-containing protein, partial [Longimicrobium sp.]
MMHERDFDVFLSYSSKDVEWAEAFVDTLRSSGVRPWSHVDIAPGEKWAERIEDALRHSHTLVFFLTPNSVDSPWTFFEIGAAIADRKRIIPIITEDVSP